MKTPQELFDHTVRHLAKQGKRARRGELCALRSDDETLSCAIGCNIPDELYTPEMENQIGTLALALGSYDNDTQEVLFAAGIGEDSVGLMMDLQRTHDGCATRNWRAELRMIGSLHGLALDVFNEPDVTARFDVLDRVEET